MNSQRVLTRLLQSERVHGTLERDPSQKRHDFRYFSRASCFVLVEDMRQELATISVHEYPAAKGREGSTKEPWPVLHCHPFARGPFIAYDERERKRWDKTQKADADQKEERKEHRNKIRQTEALKRHARGNIQTKDLRRSMSMNNLRRRATFPATHPHEDPLLDLNRDDDFRDSTNPSGYLASGVGGGYMAASGNSVGITSTTGTTSTAGYALRNVQLPAALSGRMKQEVVTSRKFPLAATGKEHKVALMGPPTVVPERQPMLKKSRSTNTLKLPKREEGSKPGYCESCRVKFDDFSNVCVASFPLPRTYCLLVAHCGTSTQEVCRR
jgi:regulatory subunit for Cdc7p protein kinase